MGVISETMQSTEIDEAEALLRRVYPIAQLRESASPFFLGQQVRGDERVVLARFAISAPTEVHVDFTGTLAFGQVISGDYAASLNHEPVDTSSPFLFRPGMGRSKSKALDIIMVNIEERAFARFAGARTGIENARLVVGGSAPLSPSASRSWERTVAYVTEIFDMPDALNNDLVRNAAVEMLYAAALASFHIEVVGVRAAGASDDALPSTVRRALAFIDNNLDQPITIDDIAEAARLSIRGLQAAFRRHLDTTPVAALRNARLSVARKALQESEPGSTTVSAIALAWGFHNLGRFAADYRAAYGELPRQTLDR